MRVWARVGVPFGFPFIAWLMLLYLLLHTVLESIAMHIFIFLKLITSEMQSLVTSSPHSEDTRTVST